MVSLGRNYYLSKKWTMLIVQNCCKHFRRELSFQDLGMNVRLTRNIRDKGIRTPTEIQTKTFQRILTGENVAINSETGSGKTLAYALPIVHNVQEIRRRGLNMPRPYGLVVVPNQELLYQVSDVFSRLGANVCAASEASPLRLINTDVVVSTASFLCTYHLDVLKEVQTAVFDEADELIAKKMRKDGKDYLTKLVEKLIERSHFQSFNVEDNSLNSHKDGDLLLGNEYYDENDGINDKSMYRDERQFVFVGATMPDKEVPKSKATMAHIRSWVPDIELIQGENVHKLIPNIDMKYIRVMEANKFKLLVQTLRTYLELNTLRVLIFLNENARCVELYKQLTEFDYSMVRGYKVESDDNFIHNLRDVHLKWEGDVHIVYRDNLDESSEVFNSFNVADQFMLLTTDVASRGIDFQDIDIVIQYDFAKNAIAVLHRAGRTGRMGKQGQVINFITEEDERLATSLEDATQNGESLESLFSRRKNLTKKTVQSEILNENDNTEFQLNVENVS